MTTVESRRKAFRKALIDAGLTQRDWARENEISEQHLSVVLQGKRESRRLWTKIEQFIQSQPVAA